MPRLATLCAPIFGTMFVLLLRGKRLKFRHENPERAQMPPCRPLPNSRTYRTYGFNGTIDKTYQVRQERKLFRTFFTNFTNDLSHEEPPPHLSLSCIREWISSPFLSSKVTRGRRKPSSLPSSPYHGYIEWEEGGAGKKKRREREFPLLRHRRGKSGSFPPSLPSYHFNQEEEEEGGGHKNMFVLRAREGEEEGKGGLSPPLLRRRTKTIPSLL